MRVRAIVCVSVPWRIVCVCLSVLCSSFLDDAHNVPLPPPLSRGTDTVVPAALFEDTEVGY